MSSLRTLLLALAASTSAFTIPTFSSLTHRDLVCTPPTTHTPPTGKPRFELLTQATSNAVSPNAAATAGTWLTAVHNGAGSNAPVLVANQSEAAIFKFNHKTGDIYFDTYQESDNKTEAIPYSVRLYSGALLGTDAPAGSLAVGIVVGLAHSNFSFDPLTNAVMPPCGRFNACYVNNTSPYGVEPGMLLVWHQGAATTAANCVDVELKAINTF